MLIICQVSMYRLFFLQALQYFLDIFFEHSQSLCHCEHNLFLLCCRFPLVRTERILFRGRERMSVRSELVAMIGQARSGQVTVMLADCRRSWVLSSSWRSVRSSRRSSTCWNLLRSLSNFSLFLFCRSKSENSPAVHQY